MKKVLLVDDAIFMRKTLRNMLEKNNFEVVGEADNGKTGVQKFMKLSPDVVAMDIAMPIMDGIQALKKIKLFAPSSKVILITAIEQEAFLKEAISYGADGFIEKPFSEEEVIKVLKGL